MGKMARIMWPQEYSELRRIDELMLCGICYEYMDTSVMTPCSHNYCSLCIRKYLHYKTQCPVCFEKTFEKDLHTNRILDELILYFGKIREKLVNCISGAKAEASGDEVAVIDSPILTPVRPARMNHNQKKATPPKVDARASEVSVDSPFVVESSSLVAVASPKVLSSPGTSGAYKVASIFTPKSKNDKPSVSSKKNVPCPVCKVEISELFVNKHLDDCLKRESATHESARMESKRKPLPKLVFSLMKDAALRKKMRELGLPSQGDRKALAARFQRYSTLYNAECDKKEPRSIEELLKQCEEEENLEKMMQKFAHATNRLKITRTSEQNVIEEAQKQYLEKNKQNYDSLIASIKNREKSKKLPVRRSLIGEDEKQTDDKSARNELSENNIMNGDEEENSDEVSYSMNDYDTFFQDSDSSSACPLQHYTSDDPINFLSIQMSGSNSNSPTVSHTKASPFKKSRRGEKLPNACVSPVKKIGLNIPPEKSSVNAVKDVCNVVLDGESTDEDVVIPSPKAATRHSTKRPKLSLQQIKKTDNAKFDQNKSEGQILALSIARDFAFDSSSNDSVETGIAHETADTRTTEIISLQVPNAENTAKDISNRDKENHQKSSVPATVNRPVRKRNCVTRSCNVAKVEPTNSRQEFATGGSTRTDLHADDKVENPPRIDSPLKRRRGRRVVTPVETETKNPPRRPLRKRNSVVTDNAHKRS